MPSVATAVDVARLYDELRDCVRANDQEGLKRVFNELVRARRPVAEILGEVRSISKEREKPEPEGDLSPPREWPPRSAPSDAEQNAPGLSFRNFGPAIGSDPSPPAAPAITTSPRPERDRSPPAEWRDRETWAEAPRSPPDRTPPSPDPTVGSGFVAEDADGSAAPTELGAEGAVPALDEWPQDAAPFAHQQSTPDPPEQSTDPVASSAPQQSKAESTDQSTEPVAAELQPQRDTISLEEWPTPPRLEESIPDPAYQSFDGAISPDTDGAAADDLVLFLER